MSGAQYLLKVLLAISFLLFSSTATYAVPASPEVIAIEQPSGQAFEAKIQGDEWANWVETAADKSIVVEDDDGYWKYAEVTFGELQATDARVGIDPVPSNAVKSSEWSGDLAQLREAPIVPTTYYDSGISAQAVALKPTGGPQKVLVLLVSFTNIGIQNTEAAWSNRFFGDTGDTVKNYFKENSYNNFYFTPASETYGTANDGIVKVNLAYAHPNTGASTGDANRLIVKNALAAADAYVNFSTYDANGNNYIENNELHVVTIVAGYERSCGVVTPNVWGHRWSFWGTVPAPQLDGKYVGSSGYGGYTQQGEIHAAGGNHMATIGILCHELSHDLGLADLYNTSSGGSVVGASSLMDIGSWGMGPGDYVGGSPAHIDPWGKIYLGFASASVVTSGIYDMKAASTGVYNILRFNTPDADEYFLIENRNRSGFDDGLYYDGIVNGGIAIWHIEDSVIASTMFSNTVNNGATKGVWLEMSSSTAEPYFRNGGPKNVFDNASTPNSKLYSGVASGLSATALDPTSTSMRVQIGTGGTSVQFSPTSYSVAENGGSIILAVTRTGSTSGVLTIDYNATNGTATAGTDYTATSGTLSFADGEGSKYIAVPILDDGAYEGNETFTVTLSNASSGTITAPTATVTVTDNDVAPVIELSSATYSTNEGGTLAITVKRTGSTSGTSTVAYTTNNGTAVASTDYTATSETLTFATGETSKVINVSTLNDSLFEGDETFALTLSSPSMATLGATTSTTVTITDDETSLFRFSQPTYSVDEGATVTITVERVGSTAGAATVNYATGGGTALAGTHYNAVSGTLDFASGETSKTFTVVTMDNDVAQGSKTLMVTLTGPVGSTLTGNGGQSSASIIITDDESPSGTVVNIEFADTVTWLYVSDMGETVQAKLNGIYADGSKGDITSLATWTIEDTSVATITAGGQITGVNYGYTTVYATYNGRTISELIGVIDPNS